MKLDDRPVIDQLLNPTPLNILEEELMDFESSVDGDQGVNAKRVLTALRDRVDGLDLDLSPRTLDLLDGALDAADDVADMVANAAYRAVEDFAGRLYERFDQ